MARSIEDSFACHCEPLGQQSLTKWLRLPRLCAPRNDNSNWGRTLYHYVTLDHYVTLGLGQFLRVVKR
jgi:hypothetical protein